MTDDNYFALKRGQIVATTVAYAQLYCQNIVSVNLVYCEAVCLSNMKMYLEIVPALKSLLGQCGLLQSTL